MTKPSYEYSKLSDKNIFKPHLQEINRSVKWLSEMSGYSAEYLCNIGVQNRTPDVYRAIDIAQALGKTAEEVWGGVEQ